MWKSNMHAQAPGVVAFISAKDVPGDNKVKGGASDAPLFAGKLLPHPLSLAVS